MDPPSSLFTSNVGKLRAERALYFLPPPTLFQIDKHFKLRKFHSLLAKKFVQSDIVDNDFKKYCFHWESRTQKYFKLSFLGQKINGCIDNNKPHKWKLKLWRKTKLFSLVDLKNAPISSKLENMISLKLISNPEISYFD